MSDSKIKEEITSKIKSGDLRMKPKWYFVAGAALLFQGTFGAIVLGIFVTNLYFYHLRNYGPFGYLVLGKEGFGPFLETFPWKLMILVILSLFIAFKLLKKYEFSYSKHSFYLFIMFLMAMLLAGLVTDLAGVNEAMRQNSFLRPIYSEKFSSRNWMMGEIKQQTSDGFILETPRGDLIQVKVSGDTNTPFGDDFVVGKRVRIIGEFIKTASRSANNFDAKAVGLDGGMRWKKYQSPNPALVPVN